MVSSRTSRRSERTANHGHDANATGVKRTRLSLSQETIAIVTVGAALAGLILMNHGQVRAEREAMRAEARADREAFANQITRLVEQQGTLNGFVEGLRHAIPPPGE